MDYDGVLCKFVEVWDRLEEDGRRCCDRYDLAREDGPVCGEERVSMLAHNLDLEK